MFKRQMSVVRGQALVLLELLEDRNGSPLELSQMQSCYVFGVGDGNFSFLIVLNIY